MSNGLLVSRRNTKVVCPDLFLVGVLGLAVFFFLGEYLEGEGGGVPAVLVLGESSLESVLEEEAVVVAAACAVGGWGSVVGSLVVVLASACLAVAAADFAAAFFLANAVFFVSDDVTTKTEAVAK